MGEEQGAEEVKLLGAIGSPFVYRAQLALKLKGIQYEFLEENLQKKSELLLKYNPIHKKIPVLVHNERPINESLLIVEYIDETWKGNYPILPLEPYPRALARFWAKFVDDKVLSALSKATWNLEEKGIEESNEVLQILENELIKDKFFGGDTFGYVDIVCIFLAFWLPLIQQVMGLQLLTSDKFPKLYNWSQQVLNLPYVQETLPPKEVLFAAFNARLQSLNASK